MQIVRLKIDDLTPYKNNVKIHTQEQIEQIKKSIQQFGMNDPVGVWGKDNLIIEGHGRVLALKELGVKEVDCIRLDHLTNEERKAYTIVHNQLTMNTSFDFDMLNEEINNIDINMEDFGFDIETEQEAEFEHYENQQNTQKQVANILNLENAQYEGIGKYDIPEIKPIYKLPNIKEWIGFNEVLSDTNPKSKGVHFFIDDYQFERIWNNPKKYIDKLKQYAVVTSPDFSPYGDMPLATQIFNHYRKHWVARYLQENGVKVIPTIRASTDKRSFEWYLDGEPQNSIVIISSMWTKTEEQKEIFLKEYNTMIDKLNPCKIFLYGKKIDGLQGNIEIVETFANKRWVKTNKESD